MEATNELKRSTSGIRISSVALPAEHGGWSMLLEPIVLGLMLAPTVPALFLSLGATGAFLARHPFKLAVGNWRSKRHSARTVMAERFAVGYVVIAILGLALAIKTGGVSLLLPLLLAMPIAVLQLFYDSMSRSRALIPELAGSISTGAVATAIAISDGWPHPVAFALWVILAARSLPTILYVRARLQLLHGRQASPAAVITVHFLALLLVIGLATVRLAPVAAVVALLILLLRAIVGFSKSDRHVTAKKLGLREVGFGALTIGLVALGYAFGFFSALSLQPLRLLR